MTAEADREQSIQRSAKGMIASYGANASTQAGAMLNRMIQQRDAEGISMWRAIAKAIQRLQS